MPSSKAWAAMKGAMLLGFFVAHSCMGCGDEGEECCKGAGDANYTCNGNLVCLEAEDSASDDPDTCETKSEGS